MTRSAQQSTRTAEVTICIISERLPDRPRQLPHAWETQVVEDDVHSVKAQGIEDVLLMVVHHDKAISRCAVVTVPAPRALASWTPMKPVPPWPAVTTTVDFEVQGVPASADTANWTLQRWGSYQPLPTTVRKVERRQTAGRQGILGYAHCTMPNTSEPYIKLHLEPSQILKYSNLTSKRIKI